MKFKNNKNVISGRSLSLVVIEIKYSYLPNPSMSRLLSTTTSKSESPTFPWAVSLSPSRFTKCTVTLSSELKYILKTWKNAFNYLCLKKSSRLKSTVWLTRDQTSNLITQPLIICEQPLSHCLCYGLLSLEHFWLIWVFQMNSISIVAKALKHPKHIFASSQLGHLMEHFRSFFSITTIMAPG